MKTKLFFLGLFMICSGLALRAADFKIVANRDIKTDAMSTDDFKSILLGAKTRLDGTAIRLAVLSDGAVHEQVILSLTAKSSDQFEKYWKKQVFTGKGVMPDQFKSDADLVAFVAKTTGAIGYIASSSDAGGAKIISIQ